MITEATCNDAQNSRANPTIYSILDRVLNNNCVSGIDQHHKSLLKDEVMQRLSYQPKIGLFGKTGVGKSSLCNALFGKPIAKISHVDSCTREAQHIKINHAPNKGVVLIDVPGVGENGKRDEEYGKLYAELLPETDAILWLLKADDRAYSTDETFYKSLVKPLVKQGKPFFIVLSQADKIDPFREWNVFDHAPGPNQAELLQQKIRVVANQFGVTKHQVIPVSSEEHFQLDVLMERLLKGLPPVQRIISYEDANPEVIKDEAKRSVGEAILEVLLEVAAEVMGVVSRPFRDAFDAIKYVFF
jgi:predicted GTPase